MMTRRTTPSYIGLEPASASASKAARGASKKRDTSCELLLRRALRQVGLHSYRIACAELPGRPDIVFRRSRVAVFCDGEFWHGRDLEARLARLVRGHNAPYWVAKIQRNVERDRAHDAKLVEAGWTVMRFWESDVRRDGDAVARKVAAAVTRAAEAAR